MIWIIFGFVVLAGAILLLAYMIDKHQDSIHELQSYMLRRTKEGGSK